MADSPPPLSTYLHETLTILECNLRLAQRGSPECYRVVAAQLRLLLCDTTRAHGQVIDISLARRLWPDLQLHPLNAAGQYDRKLPPLPLTEWLAQPVSVQITTPGTLPTLRELIRLVTDQDGGAHVDLKPHSPLWGWIDRAAWILRTGEYIIHELGSLQHLDPS